MVILRSLFHTNLGPFQRQNRSREIGALFLNNVTDPFSILLVLDVFQTIRSDISTYVPHKGLGYVALYLDKIIWTVKMKIYPNMLIWMMF